MYICMYVYIYIYIYILEAVGTECLLQDGGGVGPRAVRLGRRLLVSLSLSIYRERNVNHISS